MPRVLVCDDDQNLRSTLLFQLKQEGFDVSEARGGDVALTQIAIAPPDAMVLDLRMPEIDGLEVLRRLRNTDRSVPTVVLTAFGGIDAAVEATKLGAASFLAKPF